MAAISIEQLIEEIQVYIDNSKPAGMLSGGNMVKVNRDELISMLDDVKMHIPDAIIDSQKILAEKDSIIADAREKANTIIDAAAKEAQKMIDENEIVALSKMRAEEIDAQTENQTKRKINEAKERAQSVQIGALEYTQSVLAGLEDLYANMIEQEKNYFNAVIAKLDEEYKMVQENKYEIDIQLNSNAVKPVKKHKEVERR